MTNLSTAYLSLLPLVSRVAADAKVLNIGLVDFVLDAQYQIDVTALVSSRQLQHGLQSMYIDASNVLYGNTTMQIAGTGQSISILPQHQGYFPILCTLNSYVFTFTNKFCLGRTPGSGSAVISFANIPVVAAVWDCTLPASGYGVGGYGEGGFGS